MSYDRGDESYNFVEAFARKVRRDEIAASARACGLNVDDYKEIERKLRKAPDALATAAAKLNGAQYDPAKISIVLESPSWGACEIQGIPVEDLDLITLRAPAHVRCPRCKGSGQEALFMSAQTCEICHGAKVVTPTTATAEIAQAKSEGRS